MSVPAFEMSPVEQKRLQASLKTATGTFNQAVAVSQDALNDGLYYLFDKFEELKKMEVNSKKFGSINASMSYSEISLPVKSSNYRTVVFYCIFESGQLIVTDDMGYEYGGAHSSSSRPSRLSSAHSLTWRSMQPTQAAY